MTVPRLTFPSYDIGGANIVADGKCVGFALAEFWNWRAYLFPVARGFRTPVEPGCEEVTARTLGELRCRLRDRVAAEGPWWAA